MAAEPDRFERIINKKCVDLKHIETERHWFLGAFAVAVAGILAFLAQNTGDARLVGTALLTVLSFVGWVHAMRAGWMLQRTH